MIARKVLLAAAVAAPLFVAQAAHAQASFDLRIGTPPPPPRVVVAPEPRPGYVWTPGYWNWEGRRHVWHDGVWLRERRGYHYVDPRWEPYDGGYGFRRGHWERG